MAETFDDFFLSLLFGEGNLIGLVLVLAFFILLTLAWKYSSVLLIPASLLFALSYVTHDLILNAIIMTCFTVFGIFHASKELR